MISIRKYPVNLKASDQSFFSHELTREIPDQKIIHYNQAIVTPDGVVISNDGIEGESLYESSHKIYFTGLYKLYYRLSAVFMRNKSEPFLLAFDAWSAGYFHWMTEFVPRLFKARDVINGMTVILPTINNAIWNKPSAIRSLYRKGQTIPKEGYFVESLEAFDIKLKYRHRSGIPLVTNNLSLSSHLAMSGNYNESTMQALREFYFKFYGIEDTRPHKLVYVSRKLATRRYVENEGMVIEKLKMMGFEILTLETLTFREQVALMANTKFLITQHGAALTNLLFMRGDSFVLELKSEGDSQNLCYFSLASAMNVKYLYQFCKGDGRIVQDANITVDLEELDRNVRLIL